MIKPNPEGRPLECGATIHRWLGLRWYGWPFPLRWGWFYERAAIKFLRPWDKRLAAAVPQTAHPTWLHYGVYRADAWWKFRRSAFKGCGCIVPLKDVYNRLKKGVRCLRTYRL